MNLIIKRRGVRWFEEVENLEDLPDMKDIKLVARLIRHGEEILTLQYVLYFETETYSIDCGLEDFEEVTRLLDEKFKAAGVNPKLAKGTLEPFWGDEHQCQIYEEHKKVKNG